MRVVQLRKTARIVANLSPELMERLHRACDETNTYISDVVAECLERGLDRYVQRHRLRLHGE